MKKYVFFTILIVSFPLFADIRDIQELMSHNSVRVWTNTGEKFEMCLHLEDEELIAELRSYLLNRTLAEHDKDIRYQYRIVGLNNQRLEYSSKGFIRSIEIPKTKHILIYKLENIERFNQIISMRNTINCK